jgi:hypothetical protein
LLTSRRPIYNEREGTDSGVFQLEVGTGSNGTNRVAVTTSGVWNLETNNNAVSTNTWQHIVYTRDGTTQKLYVNGVSQSLLTDNPQTLSNTTNVRLIGAFPTASQYFSGVIDEVRVYNRALSAAEVLEHYLSSKGR